MKEKKTNERTNNERKKNEKVWNGYEKTALKMYLLVAV